MGKEKCMKMSVKEQVKAVVGPLAPSAAGLNGGSACWRMGNGTEEVLK